MDIKKTKPANGVESSISAKKAVEFTGDIKAELFRITWPTWEELKTYTQIVVIATLMFGIGLYLTDLTIQSVLHILGSLARFIGG